MLTVNEISLIAEKATSVIRPTPIMAITTHFGIKTVIENAIREALLLSMSYTQDDNSRENKNCPCKAETCTESWEPGCDLGNNEAFVEAAPTR